MPRPPAGKATCRALVATLGVGLVAGSLLGGTANAAPATAGGAQPLFTSLETPLTAGRYIVQLADEPAATYTGDVSGFAATQVAPGDQLEGADAQVEAYTEHLESVQTDVAASVGATPDQQYSLAFNGFSADLSAEQATELAGQKGVTALVPDEIRQLDTNSTPQFLGLEGEDGVWAQNGGPEAAGEGVVVGIIDSGIWPENASFAGEALGESATDDGTPYLDGDAIVVDKNDGTQFAGVCQTTEDWTADLCTEKVVGARYYTEGFFGPDPQPEDASPNEFFSPRDGDSHGSHTASTAAGNYGVDATVGGIEQGTISGMAPAAMIATYKVCWDGPDETVTTDDGCASSDLVAAIDDAVLDGVDVINFSIGGGAQTEVADPVEFAFLSAASAGIFVAASAGNSGPGASTLDHASPWLTTVAASTEEPAYASVVLGDGTVLPGVSSTVTDPVGPAPIVNAAEASVAPAPADAALCPPGGLDPAVVTGAIVVCERGVYDRVAKSAEVARAGGIGLVLANPTDNSLDIDLHSVPTVHINPPFTAQAQAYASTDGATATLVVGNESDVEFPYPQIAGFSSRGPAIAGGGDVLKPDISAPGVGILAAVAEGPTGGENYGFLSGTSMSSPHIAGLAALYFGIHPDWSPMAVKSAMMTTAYDLLGPDGAPAPDAFAQGAGHVDPSRFLNPGLVYDSGVEDWLSYIQGTGFDTGIPDVEAIDPSDLNQASIAVGALTGTQTITRTVTAVTPGLYRATATVPGMNVRVTPSVLSFTAPGQTKTFRVTLTNSGAELDAYTSGFLTWQGGRTSVRSPIAVRPVALDAPAEISGSGAEGTIDVPVVAGYTGEMDVTVAGLAAGAVEENSVALDEDQIYPFTVPAGTSLTRIDLDAADDTTDLDLFLHAVNPDGTPGAILAQSASGSADEQLNFLGAPANNYFVRVNGYSTAGAASADYRLETFNVTPETTLGSPTVTPNPVPLTVGRTTTFQYSWSGLDAATPYLGWLGLEGVATPMIVSIN